MPKIGQPLRAILEPEGARLANEVERVPIGSNSRQRLEGSEEFLPVDGRLLPSHEHGRARLQKVLVVLVYRRPDGEASRSRFVEDQRRCEVFGSKDPQRCEGVGVLGDCLRGPGFNVQWCRRCEQNNGSETGLVDANMGKDFQ